MCLCGCGVDGEHGVYAGRDAVGRGGGGEVCGWEDSAGGRRGVGGGGVLRGGDGERVGVWSGAGEDGGRGGGGGGGVAGADGDDGGEGGEGGFDGFGERVVWVGCGVLGFTLNYTLLRGSTVYDIPFVSLLLMIFHSWVHSITVDDTPFVDPLSHCQ